MNSLDKSELNFESRREAERWFTQLRQQWKVSSTGIHIDKVTGCVVATAEFPTEFGHLIPADPSENKKTSIHDRDDVEDWG